VLQYSFNWKCLSAMAGITIWNFYFRLFPGSIKAPQVIEFLKHLQQHIGGRLTVIWDGLPAHRSRLVREYVAQQHGSIHLERLPAYAPELNPVEYIWGYCKQHELPNLCPKDFAQLGWAARKRWGGCVAAQPWWNPSGNRRNCFENSCHYIMRTSVES
jgi:transposase